MAASFEQLCQEADSRFRRLKVAYERHWAGVERAEPLLEREAVRALYTRLEQQRTRVHNTAQAFLLQSMNSSFRAFDELCTRRAARALDQVAVRRASRAAPTPTPAHASAPLLPADTRAEPAAALPARLWADYVALCEKRHQPLPLREQFEGQITAQLTRARAQLPNATLTLHLQENAAGGVQLVVRQIAPTRPPA